MNSLRGARGTSGSVVVCACRSTLGSRYSPRMRHVVIGMIALALAGAGCSSECDPTAEACTYVHSFPQRVLQPGEEQSGVCQSWTLNNPTELWVNAVEMENRGVFHHSNWFFVPDNTMEAPDGWWNCDDYEFDELIAAILGGYIFAQTTQTAAEDQRFVNGAAVRIPPYSRIIGSSHLLNASDSEKTTSMDMTLHTLAEPDVGVKLAPARIEYHDLEIVPNGRSSFTTDCYVADSYRDVMGVDWKFTIYHMLPHYHELGIFAEMALLGGPRDGEVIYRHDGYGGENFGHTFDPPIDFAAEGATGIRYTCGFDNPRNEEVRWGIGDQEMCVTAIFADTDMAFQGDVGSGDNQVTGTLPDGTVTNSGPCSILGIPWDHNKEGGPPR